MKHETIVKLKESVESRNTTAENDQYMNDIILIGKTVFIQIPNLSNRCKGCFLLRFLPHSEIGDVHVCLLRPSYGLVFDKEGPFKAFWCPKKAEKWAG